ncbi:DUF4365 domain-containing protein, partial [Streptomyces sp. 2MCAF27]
MAFAQPDPATPASSLLSERIAPPRGSLATTACM